MGINERDYMRRRDSSPRFSIPKALAIAFITLLVIGSITRCHYSEEPTPATQASLRVNINTAPAEELESIPQIGPSRAKSIIDHRPYGSIDELVAKKIVGPKILESIRRFIKTEHIASD